MKDKPIVKERTVMAKSMLGATLGFFNTITTRVMVGIKDHEEEVLGLPEETIRSLADEFAQKLVSAVEEAKKVLWLIGSVFVPAVERFAAAEAFGEGNSTGLKFWVSKEFKENFFGKIELDIPVGKLNIHEFMINSLMDESIRKELGAEHEETKLAHFYELLKGKSGWFLAYIKDVNGNLWAVDAIWKVGRREWDVYASSVTRSREWVAGRQVVSSK